MFSVSGRMATAIAFIYKSIEFCILKRLVKNVVTEITDAICVSFAWGFNSAKNRLERDLSIRFKIHTHS